MIYPKVGSVYAWVKNALVGGLDAVLGTVTAVNLSATSLGATSFSVTGAAHFFNQMAAFRSNRTLTADMTDGAAPTTLMHVVGGDTAVTVNSMVGDSGLRVFCFWINANANPAHTHTFKHEAGVGTAGLRFACPGAVDYVLGAGKMALLWYDATLVKWRVLVF